jgi:chromosome segregation protein
MHLQSLELFGFKSFADKTVFNFHEGITAIVGPNGCGKSNLLDAVRWVLGEQSAKSLRGGEMADVIFNGTDSRRPLGFAEVSLTFTDCGADLGTDWHDVRVTRRVYRDGNSEYFLNKSACRLKDIQNLFADTGVARSAYSMMEQGKIDLILSSRPEDRRAVFEEAAGITKYKSQKREALRKLEATEANLLRIGDVIKEVKRQIGSLQRQAGKARRYQALHADLRVLDTHYSRKQLDSLERDLTNSRRDIEKSSESERDARTTIEGAENEIADERRALDKIDIEVAEMRNEVQQMRSEIATHESRIEFNRQRGRELSELIERASSEIAAAEGKHERQTAEMGELDTRIEESKNLFDAHDAELQKLTNSLREIQSERANQQGGARELQTALAKLQGRVATLEDELSGTVARRDATAERIEGIATEIRETTKRREKVTGDIAAAVASIEDEKKRVEKLFADSRQAEANVRDQRNALAEAEKNLTDFERGLTEKRSRLDVLRQLNQEGRGLAEGSQALLTEMKEKFREAIVGPLVSQLEVDSKFIAAIEAALGRNLHAVILNNGDAAADIISRLSRKKLGKAALLIPQLATSFPQSVRKTLPNHAICWAIDKVSAPRQLEQLVRHLLGNVVIFSKLEQGLECKKSDPTLAIATLDGEFISTEGIVFGGSATTKTDSLLERKAEITALEKEEASLLQQRDSLAQKRDAAQTAVTGASQKLDQSREVHQSAHLSHSTSSGQISLHERERDEIARKIDNLQAEKSTLEQQIAMANERITGLESELKDVRADLAAQQKQQNKIETAQETAAAREAAASEKLNDFRLTIATEKQRHESLLIQREPMAARVEELTDLIATRQSDISSYQTKLENQTQESRDSEASIAAQKVRCKEAETAADKTAQKRTTHLSTIAGHETKLRGVRDSLSEMQEERGHLQVRESQLQMQIENLAENISRRYQVDLRAFAPDQTAFDKTLRVQLKRRAGGSSAAKGESGSDLDANNGGESASVSTSPAERPIHQDGNIPDEDLQKVIVDLQRQLDNMGPVNLEAVQEYDELEERSKFLETQNTDLTNSRRELLDVIARINSTTKKLFADTFAQVRANFKEMFSELFGGGRADLSLMDENDPLNCGIEITAKPPGKQLQSISLLSGGERAMTAVSLLFAIYMVRPSPFCVLDEIDAPLDESNINRFIRMLDRFVAQSQFVIITHNKRTIAKADVLYGVTMEERGISKLVGMKLTAPPSAEQSAAPRENVPTQRQFAIAENGNGHGRKASVAGR